MTHTSKPKDSMHITKRLSTAFNESSKILSASIIESIGY